jgi:probable F420-dependent oxidoreductase
MRIGFCLPQYGKLAARPDAVTTFARGAEEIGADSLWAGDRLLAAVSPIVGYVGSPDVPAEFRMVLDPFAVLTAAAAVTSRTLLGTSVLNAPFYPPSTLARSLTSIDVISGGRLIPGFGTGWSPEEYQAVGVPMNQRGARLDECLDVLQAWWTGDPTEHHGKYWDIAASHIDLKPVQSPRPPVYLSAWAPAALRRVARRADGWLPSGVIPGRFDPAGLAATLEKIRHDASEAGRDPESIGVALRINAVPPATAADIADACLRAGEVGIGHAFADFMYLARNVDEALGLASEVYTRVSRG